MMVIKLIKKEKKQGLKEGSKVYSVLQRLSPALEKGIKIVRIYFGTGKEYAEAKRQ